jgi:hypothetical protein
MNKGTQISEILKSQGFKFNDYNATGIYSTKTGLTFIERTNAKSTNNIEIVDNEDGTYNIGKLELFTSTVIKSNISKDMLATSLKEIISNF